MNDLSKIKKDKILIVGGYGAVGSVLAKTLAARYPDKVIVGGRNKEKAWQLINSNHLRAIAIEIDLEKKEFSNIPFEEIHTAICCIEVLSNNYFIERCIKEQVNYTELATSFEAYNRLMKYKEEIIRAQIVLIPGVGLMPGLSNVFAFQASNKMQHIHSVNSFLLLGLGELHGLDAIRWMLAYAHRKFSIHSSNGIKQVRTFSDPVAVRLLNERKNRVFYRWDFADQHVIPKVINVKSAETRMAFDSRFVTLLFAGLQKTGILRIIKRVNPAIVRKLLSMVRMGTNQFAVQTRVQGMDNNKTLKEITYLASGAGEALATGIIASYAVECMYNDDGHFGIKHFEEFISMDYFFQFIKSKGIAIQTEIK